MSTSSFVSGDSAISETELMASSPADASALKDHPHSLLAEPIFASLSETSSKIVGMLYLSVFWDRYLAGILPSEAQGVYCVVSSDCGDAFTYFLENSKVR